eukprot:1342206-Prymnesium_polylepis.1
MGGMGAMGAMGGMGAMGSMGAMGGRGGPGMGDRGAMGAMRPAPNSVRMHSGTGCGMLNGSGSSFCGSFHDNASVTVLSGAASMTQPRAQSCSDPAPAPAPPPADDVIEQTQTI